MTGPQIQRERELKLDVPDGFEVPPVEHVAPGSTIDRATVRLRSTYYDTDTLALLGHAVTLRRREGDEDNGWQLKVPAGQARNEIRLPLDDRDVPPDAITDLLVGLVRPDALAPVATLDTERRLTRVHRNGGLVVEIADDRVTASTRTGHTDAWRELEIELGPAGDEQLLASFADALAAAGARPAGHASKLGRALGQGRPTPGGPGRAVLSGYLYDQFRRLVAGDIALRSEDVALRSGDSDAVRGTRVAVRRIRAALRVFAGAVDPAAGRALAAELAWYQHLLGGVRDRQVQRERLAAAVAALDPELVLGPVASYVEQALLAEQDVAGRELLAALGTNRYRRLLAAVAGVAAGAHLDPTVRPRDLRRDAERAARTAAKRLTRVVDGTHTGAVHRARTAAARARYAAELVGNTPDVARAHHRVQDVLGEHQDAIVAAETLRRLAAGAGPGVGFTLGVLHRYQLDLAHDVQATLPHLPR